MSKKMSPDQLRRVASSMSSMGRNGDTQLVHVNQQEVDLLEQIGSGTTNPQTGLREFFFGYDSIGDMFDGGGAGGSGANYSTGSHEDYVNNNPNDSTAKAHTPTSKPTTSSSGSSDGGGVIQKLTGYTGIRDMFDGGGMGRSGDTYGHGDFSNLDKNNDGRISRGESGGGLQGGIDGDRDNPFSSVTNVMAMVASPVSFIAGRALKNIFDDGTDSVAAKAATAGARQVASLAQTTDKSTGRVSMASPTLSTSGGSDGDTSVAQSSQASPVTAPSADEAVSGTSETYSDVNDLNLVGYNKFNSSRPQRYFMNYDYTDGNGSPTGTYNGEAKPLHIATSAEFAESFALSEQASNSIENMISELPPDVMDEVEGDISVHPTKDGKIALIVGNSKDGFIEATYEGANGGYTNVLQDIKRMTNHMGETRDTKVDAGFMGRVASASRFKGVATPSLEAEISSLRSEVMLYTDGSPQQRAALDRIKDYQREVSRRTNDGSERSSGFSIAALTSTIADTAKGMLV